MRVVKLMWITVDDDIENCLKFNAIFLDVLSKANVPVLNLTFNIEISNIWLEGLEDTGFNGNGMMYIREEDYEKVKATLEKHSQVINPELPDRIYVYHHLARFTDIEKRDWNNSCETDALIMEITDDDIPLSVFHNRNISCFWDNNSIYEDWYGLNEVTIDNSGNYISIRNGNILTPEFYVEKVKI